MNSFPPIRHFIFYTGMCWMLFAPMLGCESRERQKMMSESVLREKIKVGDVARVGDILKKSNGTVCVLYPYQLSVSESVPHSAQINAHLKATNYVADESHWSLVFIENDTITVSTFKRSEKLDILATHEIRPVHKENIPQGFEPMNCAPMALAGIAKIDVQNRIYLILGKIK